MLDSVASLESRDLFARLRIMPAKLTAPAAASNKMNLFCCVTQDEFLMFNTA